MFGNFLRSGRFAPTSRKLDFTETFTQPRRVAHRRPPMIHPLFQTLHGHPNSATLRAIGLACSKWKCFHDSVERREVLTYFKSKMRAMDYDVMTDTSKAIVNDVEKTVRANPLKVAAVRRVARGMSSQAGLDRVTADAVAQKVLDSMTPGVDLEQLIRRVIAEHANP